MPLALLALLWLLTCATPPVVRESVGEGAAPADVATLLSGACERALASLAPDRAPRASVEFPPVVEPALRALHGTGMGGRVDALDAAVGRAALLALADVRPELDRRVAAFAPASSEAADGGADDAVSVAFRTASEEDLRSTLRRAAEPRLAEVGAHDALEGVRNGASRLPLPRAVDLDLPSVAADEALRRFFVALADEERQLRKERVALQTEGLQ